jgi:ADP-ribose pyrophosphatase YjhB (NUDIX family)
MSELPIREQARAVIINDLGEVLLVRHEDTVPSDPNQPERLEYWVCPGGKREDGETWIECAAREAQEETGIAGLLHMKELTIYRKPLQYGEGMRMMVAYYHLFRCEGKPTVRPNDPDENITDARWWSFPDIKGSSEWFLPEAVFEMIKSEIGEMR